jgi:hypothetical protein
MNRSLLTLSLLDGSRYACATLKSGEILARSHSFDGHCQDASTRSNLLSQDIDIAATFIIRLIRSEFNLFLSLSYLLVIVGYALRPVLRCWSFTIT